MKRIFFTFLLASFCFNGMAQKTKTFQVAKTQLADISGLIKYSTDGKVIDTSYIFLGRDSRYS